MWFVGVPSACKGQSWLNAGSAPVRSPRAWEEAALQLCCWKPQPCCTHTPAWLRSALTPLSSPRLSLCCSQAFLFVRLGPPRAVECERERELLQSFRLKGRQSNKHSKHKLWQPFKMWKWKLESSFKHTDNCEAHTVFGSALICDRPDVHKHLSLHCMAGKTWHSAGCFPCK